MTARGVPPSAYPVRRRDTLVLAREKGVGRGTHVLAGGGEERGTPVVARRRVGRRKVEGRVLQDKTPLPPLGN